MIERIDEEYIRASQRATLQTLRRYGAMTVDELMERIPRREGRHQWSESRIRASLSELKRKGYAFKTGVRRPSRRGVASNVWDAVPTLPTAGTETALRDAETAQG